MNTDDRNSIDGLRTVANYAIVLMHAWAAQTYVLRGTFEYKACDFVCNAATAAVLPALFLISGYLLARGWEGGAGEKIVRRVKRLAVPYLVWNTTFVLFYLTVCSFVPRMAERVASFELNTWSGALVKIVSFMTNPLDMPTWFMRTLFLYAFLAFLIYPLLKWRKGAVVYGLLGAWFAVSWGCGWGSRLCFTYPFYSILSFTLGMHLQILGKSPFDLFRWKGWIPLAVVGMAGLFWHDIRWHWNYSPVRDASFMLMMPLMFTLGPWLGRVCVKIPHWDFFRRSSFFLYTGHFLFCSCVLHVVGPCLRAWQFPGKLVLLIVVFCTVGVAVNLFAWWAGKKVLGRAFGCWDGSL